MAIPSPLRGGAVQLVAVVAVALVARVLVAPGYFGWEEGDYGNLMMIREVLDSGFTWFRPAHMPGWYVLGAVARSLGGGDRLPALAMTMAFSVVSVGLATSVARHVAGAGAAWLVGLWLALQPEMLLYGASTLRSPVFTCLGLLGLFLLVRGREAGHAATAAAFLVRMEAFFVFFLPSLWTAGPGRGRRLRSLLPAALALGAVVAVWQAYLVLAHGENEVFFAGPMGANTQGEDGLVPGLFTAWHLATWTLPRKVSWVVLLLAGAGAVAVLRGHGRPGGRAVALYAAFTLGFWLAEGFVSRQDVNHNLFWVWLMPALPPLVILAGIGWESLAERLPRPARALAFGAALLAVAPVFRAEVDYQQARSEAWYRPQLELARWLEDHAPAGAGMVLGSIPEVWVQRREHPFRVSAWWFLPPELRGQPPEALGRFFAEHEVDYVMWFAEEWTDAPGFAPWLADGQPVDAGPVRFVPVDREDGYGWILYVVERDGRSPPRPPAFGRGAGGPGWGPWPRSAG